MRSRAESKNLPGVFIQVLPALHPYLKDKVDDFVVGQIHTNAEAKKFISKTIRNCVVPKKVTKILLCIGLTMAAGHLKQHHLSLKKTTGRKICTPYFRAASLTKDSTLYQDS